MSYQGNPIFTSYIQENSGDLNPETITTNRPPIAPINQAVFQPINEVEEEDEDDAPAQLSGTDLLRSLGIPLNRGTFREQYNTIQKLRELGARLPPSMGKYAPRADTKVKTAQDNIIERIKKVIDGGLY
jgi:hypothetical protein